MCPGPNIAYFSKVATLRDMTDHIYGRASLIDDENRPHMFVKELILNIKYLEEQILAATEMDKKVTRDLLQFSNNLLKGISYYRQLSSEIPGHTASFEGQLTRCETEVDGLIRKLEAFGGGL
jgi:ParB-like chromosome segregation protein Spo0J